MAQGSYQKAIGQDFLTSMSQSTVSRSLTEVADLIVLHLGYLIHFPGTDEERNEEKVKFMAMENGFPGIVGCVDGTHIAPKTNDEDRPGVIYYCRKHFYSLNVQIICNADLKIMGINARFPGSAHDAAIWQMSRARENLVHNYEIGGDRNTYLLGDFGYPLEPWLLTTILRPENYHERNYNTSHKSVRNVIERCIGVLKQRFRCIFKHRVLNYSPDRAGVIIYACAILHNICIQRHDNLFDYDENNNENGNDEVDNVGVQHHGDNMRNIVLQNFFEFYLLLDSHKYHLKYIFFNFSNWV